MERRQEKEKKKKKKQTDSTNNVEGAGQGNKIELHNKKGREAIELQTTKRRQSSLHART